MLSIYIQVPVKVLKSTRCMKEQMYSSLIIHRKYWKPILRQGNPCKYKLSQTICSRETFKIHFSDLQSVLKFSIVSLINASKTIIHS